MYTSVDGPTPLPTRIPIPIGLIKIPVTGSAQQTAANLNSAEHPAMNFYHLAQELEGITPEQLVPEIHSNLEYQIVDCLDFYVNKDFAGDNHAIPAILRHISGNAYWWTSIPSQKGITLPSSSGSNSRQTRVQILKSPVSMMITAPQRSWYFQLPW
jgi:hypothetical protein